MRLLRRNRQPLWYAVYVGEIPLYDHEGQETGRYKVIYDDPVKAWWNIRTIDSDAEVQMFGVDAKNTLCITAPKKEFPLSETSVLWIDSDPSHPYTHRVVGIRTTLNELLFYAVKVTK